MLAALQYTFDLVRETTGEVWELSSLPKEEAAVYDMLCRADSIGVFQVESRAQMGTLPRLQPRRFYDLVVEIALIRPGPVQGGAVHPYIRRRTGEEQVSYLHPKLEPVLERTLGVPLFQEQLMQMAVAVGNCSAADADLLRRAMGSKRGVEKIERLKSKLYAGMAENGIEPEVADSIYAKIEAFANFGFAESHALSFGLLVYASSWLKLHYPAAFLAALLRAQPMGFYSPPRSPPTRGGTGCRCSGPTSCARACTRGSRRSMRVRHPIAFRSRAKADVARRPVSHHAPIPHKSPSGRSTAPPPIARPSTAVTARSRCGSVSPTSRRSARPWPSASSPNAKRAAPTATWPTCHAAPGSTPRSSRRSPRPEPSTHSGSNGARRCGSPVRPPKIARSTLRARSSWCSHRCCRCSLPPNR